MSVEVLSNTNEEINLSSIIFTDKTHFHYSVSHKKKKLLKVLFLYASVWVAEDLNVQYSGRIKWLPVLRLQSHLVLKAATYSARRAKICFHCRSCVTNMLCFCSCSASKNCAQSPGANLVCAKYCVIGQNVVDVFMQKNGWTKLVLFRFQLLC